MSCGPEIGSRLKEAQSDNLVAMLKAYLPDQNPLEDNAYRHTETAIQQHTPSPHKATEPEIPAWVKGFMEAKKA